MTPHVYPGVPKTELQQYKYNCTSSTAVWESIPPCCGTVVRHQLSEHNMTAEKPRTYSYSEYILFRQLTSAPTNSPHVELVALRSPQAKDKTTLSADTTRIQQPASIHPRLALPYISPGLAVGEVLGQQRPSSDTPEAAPEAARTVDTSRKFPPARAPATEAGSPAVGRAEAPGSLLP